MSETVIWVTGAHGFLGSHLARAIAAGGARVVSFGRPSTPPRAEMAALYPLTPEGFAKAVAALGMPRRVYHLAGGATVGRSLADPHGDFESNVLTTETLLETLRGLKARAPLVLTSSAAVYGEGHEGPIMVGDPMKPSSPYGHHKVIAEQLVRAHAECFGTGATVLRLFSIYGPGLRKQLLFDACTRLATADPTVPLTLGGSGYERRDWLYVEDTVKGMMTTVDPAPGEVRFYNLASGQGTDTRDVALELVRAWGDGRSVDFTGVCRPGDPFSLVADPSSLPPRFIPQVGLAEGLSRFVSWFRSYGHTAGAAAIP